jgi:hypothetical protein
MKIHVVDCFKLERLTSLVGIACLSCLGRFQIGLDAIDYLFGLNDKIKIKDHPLAMLDPVPRCTTATTIQSFEMRHSKTLLKTVVI